MLSAYKTYMYIDLVSYGLRDVKGLGHYTHIFKCCSFEEFTNLKSVSL